MADNDLEFTADTIRRLLGKLNAELERRGQKVVVYVVGGANMALAVDSVRTTTDIDAVVKHGHQQLTAAAAAVAGTEPGLAPDWINSEFTGGDNPTGGLIWQWFDKRDDDEPVSLFEGSGLDVQGASAEMMLALKTLANRDQDISDAHKLMRRTGIVTPTGLGRNLARFTGRRIFEVQGTMTLHPRIDPEFRHIFDSLPEDMRPVPAQPDRSELCGVVKVTMADGREVARTRPCSLRKGHRLWHRFNGEPAGDGGPR